MWFRMMLILVIGFLLTACNPLRKEFLASLEGSGGGQDLIVVEMPFASGYRAQCVQGPGGGYSHSYNSTRYDIDLDTPNNRDDPVFAPIAGKVRIHADPNSAFGLHVNIDLGDGTYVNLSHLSAIFVEDGEDVAQGQLLGFEGTTGASTGDHVHMGRHLGNAALDAGRGTSIEGLSIRFAGSDVGVLTSDLLCGLAGGATYRSTLEVSAWHPNGSLVMAPNKSTVYLIENDVKRPFMNEEAFWSRHYEFQDVAIVTEDELDCYGDGPEIFGPGQIRAAYDGNLWLLVGTVNDPYRERFKVRLQGWEGVLATWGIYLQAPEHANDAQAMLDLQEYPVAGNAQFRDGSLVVGIHDPTVFMISDGVAMPILNWDTLLLLDLHDHYIVEVEDESIPSVMGRVGDCSVDVFCIDAADVATCGGPEEEMIVTEDPMTTCGWHTLTWHVDNTLSDGQFLSSAMDVSLWVLETGQWWDNPAGEQVGLTTQLSTSLYACSGDRFTVNGSFTNFADVPHGGDGQWWMCADPWNPRYWGTFLFDGSVITTSDWLDVYSVDLDGSGGPSALDEVGCYINVP